jgi:hypothetical protein
MLPRERDPCPLLMKGRGGRLSQRHREGEGVVCYPLGIIMFIFYS